MPSDIELEFRIVEQQLDSALQKDRGSFAASGIEVADWSARHKNERFAWSHTFVSKQPRGSEFAKISVTVSTYELDLTTVTFRRCTEIFQACKQSRWKQIDELVMPVNDLLERGIAVVVMPWMLEGHTILSTIT
jgi:hypothetical protein